MADLPQHAGQVALLHDLIAGRSPWSDVFRLNLFTPYLLGYGLALPLSFLMSTATALKLLLSLAYLAFVASFIGLRKHFNADPRLDWLFLLSFFGPAYAWGFLTFLIAAPVAIFFVLLADRYTKSPTATRGLATLLVGLALLLSHGLVFVFGVSVAGALYVLRTWRNRQSLRQWVLQSWPLLLPCLACLAYFLISRSLEQQYGGISNVGSTLWHLQWKRLPKIFINSLGGQASLPVLMASTALALVPWLLGLRIDSKRPANAVLFAVCMAVALVVPMFALATGILYLRFALFTLPAYALLFSPPTPLGSVTPADVASKRFVFQSEPLAMVLMVGATWLMLGVHSYQAWRFAAESRDFEPVLAAMAPAQRVLYLPLDRESQAANNPYAYLHFASWYQSDKQGLVDFNFAWFPPQLARFKPDYLPAVTYGFEHTPTQFSWPVHKGQQYRYFVIRHTQPLPPELFKGADCMPGRVLSSGNWTLLERLPCNAAAQNNAPAP